MIPIRIREIGQIYICGRECDVIALSEDYPRWILPSYTLKIIPRLFTRQAADQRGNDVGVPLDACPTVQTLQRRLTGLDLGVGPRRGHRVIGVQNRDDPWAARDHLAG